MRRLRQGQKDQIPAPFNTFIDRISKIIYGKFWSIRNQDRQAVVELQAFLLRAKSPEAFEWEYVDFNNNVQMIVLDFVPFAVGRLSGEQFCFWNVQRLHRELGLEVGYGSDMKWCHTAWASWRQTMKQVGMSSMHWGYKVVAHRTSGGGEAKRRRVDPRQDADLNYPSEHSSWPVPTAQSQESEGRE